MVGRIIGHVCVKDEADRYLAESLAWQAEFCDEIHVYDDRSTDDTVSVALAAGATVTIRPERSPSFSSHEGKFRQAAWRDLQETVEIDHDDWVFGFDADEFFVSPNISEREAMESLARVAKIEKAVSWKLRVDEVFGFAGKVPLIRTDGFWSSITAVRFFKCRTVSQFANRPMGCGSAPTYALMEPADATKMPFSILHYGYADPTDKLEKYDRYTSALRSGHSTQHIQSIIKEPTLEPFPHGRFPR